MTYLGKIASNGRTKIVIDHVAEYASGTPFAFAGYKLTFFGTVSNSRAVVQASQAKISEFLNVEGISA